MVRSLVPLETLASRLMGAAFLEVPEETKQPLADPRFPANAN
jgi:hypothetical protein